MNILNKYTSLDNSSLDQMLDKLVEFVWSLEYSEMRKFEEIIGNSLVLLTSLGPDTNDVDFREFGEKYEGSNLFSFLEISDLFVDNWALLSKTWPKSNSLISLSEEVSPFLNFLRKGLSSQTLDFDRECGQSCNPIISERRKIFYEYINETFLILKHLYLKVDERPGVEYFYEALDKDRELIADISDELKSFSGYADYLSQDKSRLSEVSESMKLLAASPSFSTKALREWIAIDDGAARPGEILIYLNDKNSNGEPRIEVFFDQLFNKDFTLLRSYVDDIFSLFSIDQNKKDLKPTAY